MDTLPLSSSCGCWRPWGVCKTMLPEVATILQQLFLNLIIFKMKQAMACFLCCSELVLLNSVLLRLLARRCTKWGACHDSPQFLTVNCNRADSNKRLDFSFCACQGLSAPLIWVITLLTSLYLSARSSTKHMHLP